MDMLKRDDDDIEREELENYDLRFAGDVNDMETANDVEGLIDKHYTSASVNADSVLVLVTDFL